VASTQSHFRCAENGLFCSSRISTSGWLQLE
jgi:hypothetical protein